MGALIRPLTKLVQFVDVGFSKICQSQDYKPNRMRCDGGKTAPCAVSVTTASPYSWLKVAAIIIEGTIAKVVGPDADKFTKFYINNQAVELAAGQADLTGKTGELSLKATTADASGVIRLKISK